MKRMKLNKYLNFLKFIFLFQVGKMWTWMRRMMMEKLQRIMPERRITFKF